MDQIMVYGFCILAALILAAMLLRYRSVTKSWEKQMQNQKNSMQEMKEYHDILRIDMKCLLKDQEEAEAHLLDSVSHMKENTKDICSQREELKQMILRQEENLAEIKNELQMLKEETGMLAGGMAEVLLKMGKLESCSQSVNDVYREFLEKNRERRESVNQAGQQAEHILDLAAEFKEQLQWMEDLAEQIELLSLNTNIEAAKNEERENGFLVIALEMKKLSEESREFLGAFAGKNESLGAYAKQNKDNINNTVKLQEKEQTKITKTGFMLEQLEQETQKVIRALEEISGSMDGLETTREKIMKLSEQFLFAESQDKEMTLEELKNRLDEVKEEGSSLMKMTEEMQVRITE